MERFIQWLESMADRLFELGIALLILVLGWIVALIVARVVRRLFERKSVKDRLANLSEEDKAAPPPVGRWVGLAAFWLIMLWVLVLFFDQIGLGTATQPLNELLSKVTGYLPQLGAAAVLLLVAWIVATGLRAAVVGLLGRAKLDERLQETAGEEMKDVPVSRSIGNAVYALVFLVFLLPILDALELEGLLQPVQEMMDKIFGYLPQVLGSGLIVLVGWVVARFVRRLVQSLLAATGLDQLGDRTGLSKVGKGSLSALCGTVAYVLILVTVLAMAVEQLGIEVVAKPLQEVLHRIANAVPNLLLAAVILIVAWIVGRLLAGLVSDLLARVGFDRLFVVLGLSSEEAAENRRSPSAVAGTVVLIGVMLLAVTTSAEQLGFTTLSVLLSSLMSESTHWFKGLVIMGAGLWLANFTFRVIRERGTPQSGTFATVSRVAILALAGTIALRELNVGQNIVELAFGIAFAGLALAAALAFGLGGRDAAATQLERWRSRDGSEAGSDD